MFAKDVLSDWLLKGLELPNWFFITKLGEGAMAGFSSLLDPPLVFSKFITLLLLFFFYGHGRGVIAQRFYSSRNNNNKNNNNWQSCSDDDNDDVVVVVLICLSPIICRSAWMLTPRTGGIEELFDVVQITYWSRIIPAFAFFVALLTAHASVLPFLFPLFIHLSFLRSSSFIVCIFHHSLPPNLFLPCLPYSDVLLLMRM